MPSAYSTDHSQHAKSIDEQKSERSRRPVGPERVALLILAMGSEHAGRLASMLKDTEMHEIHKAIASLEPVDANAVEQVLADFVSQISTTVTVGKDRT